MDASRTGISDGVAPSSDIQSPTADTVGEIGRQITEFQEYVSFLIASKVDAARAAVRQAMLTVALAVIGVFTLCAFIAVGCVLLLSGIAQGLAMWLGTGIWLGYIAVGLLVLIGIAGGLCIAITQMNRRYMERTGRDEQRKAQQLARYGSNADSAN